MACGVGQDVSSACSDKLPVQVSDLSAFLFACCPGFSFDSFAFGVCHGVFRDPIQSLATMGRADAVCAQYARPDGVAFCFHVCVYSIEPTVPNRAFNLFAKDDVRAALRNETGEDWPQMPLVVDSMVFAGTGEWLAGAGSSPHSSVDWPSCELQGEAPSANPGEEMALGITVKVSGSNSHN